MNCNYLFPIKNSSIKIVKKQDFNQENIEEIKNFLINSLGLSDDELNKLLSISSEDTKKGLFIKVDDFSIILNLEIDPTQLILQETEKTARIKFDKAYYNSNENIEITTKNIENENK